MIRALSRKLTKTL